MKETLNTAQKPLCTIPRVTSSTGLSHGALFAGIGGFELGAEMSGIETKWNCEVSEFNRQELKRLFPNAKQFEDIRTMQGAESVDIISGGFPCQNISLAASKNRTGVDGDKSGLWRDMLRICGEIRPKYIILENSHTIIKHGFEIILEEFAKIGYDAEWQTLQGFQFSIPQRRRRLYAILYPTCIGNRMEEKEIFTGWHKPIYPTWRDTEPKVYGVADVISNRLDKHRALGNAVQPLITNYLFECIKANWEQYGKYCL
jgi:DNA (cytosine-5)-methyltransferase 1